MDKFTLKLSLAAVRDLDRMEDKRVKSFLEKVGRLKENPFPQGKWIKKIKGKRFPFYRLRVDKYRVFYSIEGQEVVILKVVGKKDSDKFIKNL